MLIKRLARAGTDGGGSIRIPAALCGVVGLMPTAQRLPREGCVEMACTFGTPGVLATSVADAAFVYSVIANTGDSRGLVMRVTRRMGVWMIATHSASGLQSTLTTGGVSGLATWVLVSETPGSC